MGCENSKDSDTVHRSKGGSKKQQQHKDHKYQESDSCGGASDESNPAPATKEAFGVDTKNSSTTSPGSPACAVGTSHLRSRTSSSAGGGRDGNSSTVGGLTSCDHATSSPGHSIRGGHGGLGESHTSLSEAHTAAGGDEEEDPEVLVWMTRQNSPNATQTLEVLSCHTGGTSSSSGAGLRPFDPRMANRSPHPPNPHGPLGVPMTPTGSNCGSFISTLHCPNTPSVASIASGNLTPTGANTSLRPFSISQLQLDEAVPMSRSMSPQQRNTPVPGADNNMGDTDEKHTESRLNRQIARKNSLSQSATEPGEFRRNIEETFRATKMKAVCALTHEVDHAELERVALKAENPKTIANCKRWLKFNQDPVPRPLKASTLNELKTLTETVDSIHYGKSTTTLLIQHQQQQAVFHALQPPLASVPGNDMSFSNSLSPQVQTFSPSAQHEGGRMSAQQQQQQQLHSASSSVSKPYPGISHGGLSRNNTSHTSLGRQHSSVRSSGSLGSSAEEVTLCLPPSEVPPAAAGLAGDAPLPIAGARVRNMDSGLSSKSSVSSKNGHGEQALSSLSPPPKLPGPPPPQYHRQSRTQEGADEDGAPDSQDTDVMPSRRWN